MNTDPDGPALSTEFHFHRLGDKVARDAIRKAAANARTRPVWLVNKAGGRIGAVMSLEDVVFLEAVRAWLHGGVEKGEEAGLPRDLST